MTSDSQVIELNPIQKDPVELILPQPQPKTSKIKAFFLSLFSCIVKPENKIFNDYAKVLEDATATKRVLIIYKDGVYDATRYLDSHPGGKQILIMANGKITDKLFDKYHYPFGSAPTRLKKMKIGEVRHDVTQETPEKDTRF
jgi:cytochrome b involved in lipid metabolism